MKDESDKPIKSYKKVYQYFVLSLRIGVFAGKSSPNLFYISQYWVFPAFYSVSCVFCGLIAFAPKLMKWFVITNEGHWILWLFGLPLGFAYGATSAMAYFGIRKDMPKDKKEFALSNITTSATFGQVLGTIFAKVISEYVPDRHLNGITK